MTRILVAGFGQFEWFAPAWVRGLQQLGMEVHFFDLGRWFSLGLIGRIEYRLMRGFSIQRTNIKLLQTAAQIRPDVMLIHNGNPIRSSAVALLGQKCWVSGYHHDDPFGRYGLRAYFRIYRQAIPFYNSHHVIREENLVEYQRLGVQHVRILMTYYVPWLHYRRCNNGPPRPSLSRDVVFIGHAEPDRRIKYLTDLLEAGIGLQVFGPPKYWRRHLPRGARRRLPPIEAVVGDHYAGAIGGAKICLAFYSQANRDRYAYRVFEIPACGGFLLAERTDTVLNLYDEGREAEFFASSDELIDKVRFYLRDDDARDRVASGGYERCITSGYDVVSRMKQWIRDIQEFRGR